MMNEKLGNVCLISTNKNSVEIAKCALTNYNFRHYIEPECISAVDLFRGLENKIFNFSFEDFGIALIGEKDFTASSTSDYVDSVRQIKDILETITYTNIIICLPTYKCGKKMALYNWKVENFNNLLYCEVTRNENTQILDSNRDLKYDGTMFNRCGAINDCGLRLIFEKIKLLIDKAIYQNMLRKGQNPSIVNQGRSRQIIVKRISSLSNNQSQYLVNQGQNQCWNNQGQCEDNIQQQIDDEDYMSLASQCQSEDNFQEQIEISTPNNQGEDNKSPANEGQSEEITQEQIEMNTPINQSGDSESPSNESQTEEITQEQIEKNTPTHQGKDNNSSANEGQSEEITQEQIEMNTPINQSEDSESPSNESQTEEITKEQIEKNTPTHQGKDNNSSANEGQSEEITQEQIETNTPTNQGEHISPANQGQNQSLAGSQSRKNKIIQSQKQTKMSTSIDQGHNQSLAKQDEKQSLAIQGQSTEKDTKFNTSIGKDGNQFSIQGQRKEISMETEAKTTNTENKNKVLADQGQNQPLGNQGQSNEEEIKKNSKFNTSIGKDGKQFPIQGQRKEISMQTELITTNTANKTKFLAKQGQHRPLGNQCQRKGILQKYTKYITSLSKGKNQLAARQDRHNLQPKQGQSPNVVVKNRGQRKQPRQKQTPINASVNQGEGDTSLADASQNQSTTIYNIRDASTSISGELILRSMEKHRQNKTLVCNKGKQRKCQKETQVSSSLSGIRFKMRKKSFGKL